jgi:hypothetical protein
MAPAAVESAIRRQFQAKGDRLVEQNLRAFRLGREAPGTPSASDML